MLRVVWLCCAALLVPLPAPAQDGGVYLDDAYTWFALESFGHMADRKGVTDGWSLTSNLRAFGDIANRSRFKVVVEREGGEPAVYEDDGKVIRDQDGEALALVAIGLRDRDQKVVRTGQVPVRVYYIDGRTDEEKLLRTYTIDVHPVSRIRGGGTNATPDYPEHYLDRSGDVAASIIHRRPARSDGYLWASGGYFDWNTVDVLFTHAPAIFDNSVHVSYLTAKVNGKPLPLPRDEVGGSTPQNWNETAQHSYLGDNKVAVKEYYLSRRFQVTLPLTWGAADDPKRHAELVALNDHPGDWEITWISGTEPLRTWKFTVDANGIVQHPESAAGELQLGPPSIFPDATLVETIVPHPGTRLDARLDPERAQQGYFSGLTWQTAAAKQMAAAIPARDVFAGGTTEVAHLEPTAVADDAESLGLLWDDAYTWLQIKTTKDTKDGQPYVKGWRFDGRLRLLGEAGPRDSFRIRLRQGDQELANFPAEGQPVRDSYGKPYGVMVAFPYDSPLVKTDGAVALDLFHLDSTTNRERQVKTLNLWVDKVSRQRGSRNNPQPDASEYYLDRHSEVLSSVLIKHDSKKPVYVLHANPTGYANTLDIVWHLSPSEIVDDLRDKGYARIRVDGQPLDLEQDAVRTAIEGDEKVMHASYQKPSARGGANAYTELIRFAQLSSRLPVTWGDNLPPGQVKLEDHPGQWEVEYRLGGDIIRTWRFTVTPDGSISPHPEQAHLSLPDSAWFVETIIPAGGSVADERLAPDRIARGRYGQPWGSAEGKALADGVPTKGQPAP